MRPRLWFEEAKRSFWAPPAAAMLLGGGLGFLLPYVDEVSQGVVGIFSTSEVSSARNLLEAIATVTVSVAGITFSVTVVVLQLASQQLGPRVLHTFQSRWLGRVTLAVFLGVFVYALTALGRLGSVEEPPNLVLTVGVISSIAAFALFAAFIHDIVVSIRASTVIKRIGADAKEIVDHPFPDHEGEDVADPQEASALLAGRFDTLGSRPVRSPSSGYVVAVNLGSLMDEAKRRDGYVIQEVAVGDFVVSGQELARVAAESEADALADALMRCFSIGAERTLGQDLAFPIRQLADIALRALSPSLNDPTTAENAAGAIAEVLILFTRTSPASELRADDAGVPRFKARVARLDDLVRLGFEQIRGLALKDPLLPDRLLALLAEIEREANAHGHGTAETKRQAALIRDAHPGAT